LSRLAWLPELSTGTGRMLNTTTADNASVVTVNMNRPRVTSVEERLGSGRHVSPVKRRQRYAPVRSTNYGSLGARELEGVGVFRGQIAARQHQVADRTLQRSLRVCMRCA
jgi:hypothetical protein